jgi:DNA-binding CsgD family transcriptional regulator
MASDWQISRHSVITLANLIYDKLGMASKDQLYVTDQDSRLCFWDCVDGSDVGTITG